MLFYLTDSLIIQKDKPQFPKIRRAVKYIAMAVFERKHLLRGDFEVLKFMEEEFKADYELYPVFHQLVEKFSTYTVPNNIIRYIEVVYSGFANIERDGHQIKQMEYSYFDDSKKVQEMTVVAEDILDCKLFEYMLKWYIEINHLPYNFRFSCLGGGGKRTKDTVINCLNQGNMVTCITDSDQRFAGQPSESTYNCVECARIDSKGKIYYFLKLPVLEIENLIPLNHFKELDWHHEMNRKDKEAFDKLCTNTCSECILPYFDIKEGLKKSYINQYGTGFEKFAEMCCACFPELMEGKTFKEYVEKLDDKALIYPRLRKNPLKELIPMYQKETLPKPVFMNFQRAAWEQIAKLLLDTTCARNEESITV